MRLPAFQQAPLPAVTAFAEAQAAMWADIGESAPHPGLAAAARDWVNTGDTRDRADPPRYAAFIDYYQGWARLNRLPIPIHRRRTHRVRHNTALITNR